MKLLTIDALPRTTLHRALHRALSVCRPHGSTTEAEFVAYLCNTLPVTMLDAAGNIHVDLRTSPTQRTLFTAHTDTVHKTSGVNPVLFDEAANTLHASPQYVLGADDGAGIALLVHMIHAGVAGYYVFFRGEERGGVGSRWLASNMRALLQEFDRAVAFDRAGRADVITHQGFERCCSDGFAYALASRLTMDDYWFLPDDTGVYTDTAEFTHIIPECTNVSCGYNRQHSDQESLDLAFLQALADQLVTVEWDKLPTERYPLVVDTHQPRWPAYESRQISEEDVLEDAIWSACDYGRYGDLREIVGESVWPADPGVAAKQMVDKLLTEDVLEEALAQLSQGALAGEVCAWLYDKGVGK